MIHVAIVRIVKEGRQAEFEERLLAFFDQTKQEADTEGAYLIRGLEPTKPREYGILRSFEDAAVMQRFYQSPLYQQWNDTIAPLVEGEPTRRELHGLEAFFRGGSTGPPVWKMALLTWAAVNPAVFVFSSYLPPLLPRLPPVVTFLIVNTFVVASLTWVLMPILTRALAAWLRPLSADVHR